MVKIFSFRGWQFDVCGLSNSIKHGIVGSKLYKCLMRISSFGQPTLTGFWPVSVVVGDLRVEVSSVHTNYVP